MDLIIPSDVTAAGADEARQRALMTLMRAKEDECRVHVDLGEGRPTAIALQLLIACVKSATVEGCTAMLGPVAAVALASAPGIMGGGEAT